MVGGTTHQQQQAPQLARPSALSSATAHTATSEEDELLKRNTDCVYFLASPLTCKKGSECEYRHSDIARVNPRDCWYWLNGNCLNPKCAFRHPPLDGLLGSDVSTPMGPPAPAPHATPYATPKQGVACIFFQKGFCLKGHLCPFLHGPPNPVSNKPSQPGPTNPVTEPPKIAQQVTLQKPVDKNIVPPARVIPPPVTSEPPSHKPNHSVHHGYHASKNERIVSGKDADEYSRELSPGFDVLVDNEPEEPGHYYDADRDMYRDHRDCDHYHERDGRFDVDHLENRSYPRNDRENGSDLRQRISKQRRGSENGLRSVVSRESHADRMPMRDSHHHRHLDQGPLSSRLRGRIKIPGRSISPTENHNSRVEREIRQTRVRERTNRTNDTGFAGPKRLSELKSFRTEHQPNGELLSGKRKHPKTDEGLLFEGPKPLSEILKRKRRANSDTDNNNNTDTNNNNNTEDDNQKEVEIIPANKEEHTSVAVDFVAENEKDGNSVNYGDEDALLDEELEAYDENNNEYEYEQMDGEEYYNLEEGEEEYVDEDEYAKKENAVCS